MKLFYTLVLITFGLLGLAAQPPCPDGDLSLILKLRTDGYGYEISWRVTTIDGLLLDEIEINTLANNVLYETQVCIPANTCVLFTLEDTYGDGLIGNGYFVLTLEGDTLANNPDYNFLYSQTLNCQAGETCDEAIPVTLGSYTATFDNHWYVFNPDSIGMYEISTCGLTDCDSKIWVYDNCDIDGLEESNAGVTFFDDNDSECAPQAQVNGFFSPDVTYYIRIGDNEDACLDSINWQLTYLGPVVGCTDPTSCNYNPLATVDDGSCLPQGHPECGDGPDLVMREDRLHESLLLTTINNNDPCLIEEGCVTGYGERDVIRFSTRIDNIGEEDYYIGQPNTDNVQFTWNNCHNHFHYDGYAEYLLFDSEGSQLPSGFKNGFCVLDLGCMWGSSQYGCGNMGISAGCYDEYWRSLTCQWIDITEVPDGDYTFVTRVNWDNAPDYLGRVEKDTINNWAQVCINIDRSSGELAVAYDFECEPFVDCNGTLYGNARPDCRGDCGGTAIHGDLDEDGVQEIADAQLYVDGILAQDLEPTMCNDLSGEGEITVYDAHLLSSCLNYGAGHVHQGSTIHDHCRFPAGVNNPGDTVVFSIVNADFEAGFVDIGMRNRNSPINAYQFTLQGIQATAVENLIDPAMFPISPVVSLVTNEVIGISYQDSIVERSDTMQALCRVYFSEITEPFICISEVKEAINLLSERTVTIIEDGCLEAVGVPEIDLAISTQLAPNPFHGTATLTFPNPNSEPYTLRLTNAQGQVVRTYTNIRTTQQTIDQDGLPAGVYFYQLSSQQAMAAGRMVIQ
ncbi:MAG: T9SS type A sorting domain-containing protein [Lewinella sp.]|nr:T9SS type A sorting domain-containing protein [Lewinella sp.]